MPKPILIVGAGPAGLALARLLYQRGLVAKVFDAQTNRSERGLGLWGRSQVALRSLGCAALLDDPSRTLRIPPAAYRSHAGVWLSSASATIENDERVAAVRESDLLSALGDGLPDGAVNRGKSLVGADVVADGVVLTFEDGSRVEGAAVVGADGTRSAVRRLAFGADAPAATDSGFGVHSGVFAALNSADAQHDELARGALLRNAAPTVDDGETATPRMGASTPPPRRPFETLARGRRFAMVPLPDGGGFWFASRPLEAGSSAEGSGAGALRLLRDAYDGWHAPIPQVLHAAACAAAEAAMATSAGSGGAADGGAHVRWERVYEAPRLARWHHGRAVLVGDAAHGMPHNLAQGAACAIEGAFLLGSSIAEALSATSASSRADGDGHAGEASALEAAFAAYQAAHEPRVRQCRLTTHFTAMLAEPASPATEGLRNAMALVPQPLNSMVFDTALAVSLGDAPASTRARWPLGVDGRPYP